MKETSDTGKAVTLVIILIIMGVIGYTSTSRSPQQPTASTKRETKPVETKTEYEQRVVAEQRARDRPKPTPAPDPTLLRVVNSTWEKGGFDSVAIWHVTFFNRSDKPI